MSSYKEVILTPNDLKKSPIIRKVIILKKPTHALITGNVLSDDNQPVKNALLVISKLNCNCNNPVFEEIGYSFTNDDGYFAITINRAYNLSYKIDVFSPIIHPCGV